MQTGFGLKKLFKKKKKMKSGNCGNFYFMQLHLHAQLLTLETPKNMKDRSKSTLPPKHTHTQNVTKNALINVTLKKTCFTIYSIIL